MIDPRDSQSSQAAFLSYESKDAEVAGHLAKRSGFGPPPDRALVNLRVSTASCVNCIVCLQCFPAMAKPCSMFAIAEF